MSWQSLVRGMLAEENPELNSQLLRDGEHEDYVNDMAQRMIESYRLVTAGVTDPVRRARPKRWRSHRRGKRSRPRSCWRSGRPSTRHTRPVARVLLRLRPGG